MSTKKDLAGVGGCEPVSAPANMNQSVRSRVYELGQQLSPEDYRAVAVPLYAVLNAAATSGSDTYRVPATHNLAIEQIRSHLVLKAFDQELLTLNHASDVTKGVGAPTITDRVRLKAMNCRLDLKNSDREQKLFDNHSLALASLLSGMGDPLDFSVEPHIVPAGETLLMNATLINTDAKMIGGDTEYGLVLIGKLIRVARS